MRERQRRKTTVFQYSCSSSKNNLALVSPYSPYFLLRATIAIAAATATASATAIGLPVGFPLSRFP